MMNEMPKWPPPPELHRPHKLSFQNKKPLLESRWAGCFHCLEVFAPELIDEWVNVGQATALCPFCGIDSVLPESGAYPLTREFLTWMANYWFNGPRDRNRGNRFREIADEQPYPLVFLSETGARLCGFFSGDDDHDLRGAHLLARRRYSNTLADDVRVRSRGVREFPIGHLAHRPARGVPMLVDLDTCEFGAFCSRVGSGNGLALETMLSPHVVHTTDIHRQLKSFGPGLLTQQLLGFYLRLGEKFSACARSSRQIRHLLHAYRCNFLGLRLVETGQLEPDLRKLNNHFRQKSVFELISRKRNGSREEQLDVGVLNEHCGILQRYHDELRAAIPDAGLPQLSPVQRELTELVRLAPAQFQK